MITVDALGRWGAGLKRPECVLCFSNGDVVTSSAGNGAMRIRANGRQEPIGSVAAIDGKAFIPNGMALTDDSSLLIANMGEDGGVWRLSPDGSIHPFLTNVEGRRPGATNFVLLDEWKRTWVTVTTQRWPISEAFCDQQGQGDGYLILIAGGTSRIVATNLVFANEVRVDADGRNLYLAETFTHRILRFPIHGDLEIGDADVFAELGEDNFPDGIAFDAEGFLWATSLISNRVLRIAPDGSHAVVVEDRQDEYVGTVLEKIRARTMQREDIGRNPAAFIPNPSSIAFGGPDLRTVYIGSLTNTTLITFRSPVAGLAPIHWRRSA